MDSRLNRLSRLQLPQHRTPAERENDIRRRALGVLFALGKRRKQNRRILLMALRLNRE